MYSTIQFTIHAKGYVILEKNNLRTAQEWAKSYFELTAPHVHQRAGNHLRSHLRAIIALDHRRLIRPEKKSGRIFFAFDKFTLQNLANKSGCAGVNHPFLPFIHHIWGETVPWGTVFIIKNAVFHNFAIQIALIQHSGRSKHAWAFS